MMKKHVVILGAAILVLLLLIPSAWSKAIHGTHHGKHHSPQHESQLQEDTSSDRTESDIGAVGEAVGRGVEAVAAKGEISENTESEEDTNIEVKGEVEGVEEEKKLAEGQNDEEHLNDNIESEEIDLGFENTEDDIESEDEELREQEEKDEVEAEEDSEEEEDSREEKKDPNMDLPGIYRPKVQQPNVDTEAQRKKEAAFSDAMQQIKATVASTASQGSDAVVEAIMLLLQEIIEAGGLDKEQIETICEWICANFPCPPDCPGYFEPPWG